MDLSYSLANAIKNDGVTLEIPSGTTFTITVKITKEGSPYQLAPGDIIAFGAKTSIGVSSFSIYKEIDSTASTSNGYVMTFSTSDTDLAAGRYYYDISLKTAQDEFYKLVPASVLKITDNVTNEGDVGQ